MFSLEVAPESELVGSGVTVLEITHIRAGFHLGEQERQNSRIYKVVK
jgi:hypothetical protein